MATREQLQEFVCGHGCVLDLKRGMGTNGPCRHMQFPTHLSDRDKRIWRGLLEATRVHRRRADELEAENARLREELRQRRHVGNMMSNVCFNLGQEADSRVDDEHAKRSMRELRSEWDNIGKRGTHG